MKKILLLSLAFVTGLSFASGSLHVSPLSGDTVENMQCTVKGAVLIQTTFHNNTTDTIYEMNKVWVKMPSGDIKVVTGKNKILPKSNFGIEVCSIQYEPQNQKTYFIKQVIDQVTSSPGEQPVGPCLFSDLDINKPVNYDVTVTKGEDGKLQCIKEFNLN